MEGEGQPLIQLKEEMSVGPDSSGKEEMAKQRGTVTSEDLAKYLFGLPLKEENFKKIIDKIEEDQRIIRQLYGLPPLDMLRYNPGEFERRLKEIASKNRFQIISKLECGDFFGENPAAGGVFFKDQNKIGVDIDRSGTKGDYIRSLITLEHELVHALQSLRYPQMPLEIMEY